MSQILKVIENLQKSKRINKNNNITYSQGLFLSKFVKIFNPKRILEIGTSNGYSTLWLLLNLDIKSKLITIEIDKTRFNQAKENFNLCDKERQIVQKEEKLEKYLKNYDKEEKFDLIFLDASQFNYKQITKVILDKNILDKNGVLICDNVISHNMDKFINFVKKFFKTNLITMGGGLLVCYKI